MNKIKNKVWVQLTVIYTRYLLGGTFVFASLIKIKGHRFTTGSGAMEPINSALHFFETMYQSGLYWKFIGFGQLLAGFLLMTQRYAKLGALINFPIIANIFAITLSYYFAFTPVIVALMLLANIGLILWEWDELKILINLPYSVTNTKQFERQRVWEIIGYILFLFTFIYRLLVDKYNFLLWLAVCISIGVVGLLAGFRSYRKSK